MMELFAATACLLCAALFALMLAINRFRIYNKLKEPNNNLCATENTCCGRINSLNGELPAAKLPTRMPTVMPSDEYAEKVVPLSVNYHFTRKCNYKCGFCFHTAKTSFVLPLDDAKRGLELLKNAGMKKINFSGGEPFIVKKGAFVGELVKFCKQTLGVESVSIVSNGSLVSERWFEQYGEFLDILAVSCDSFDADTNEKIGRQQGQKSHLISLRSVRRLCADYKVAFKLNTVVNTHNKDENMVEEIMQLNPCRWKVFQCLLIDGENTGPDALRRAESFVITNAEFDEFLRRHKDVECLVPESNEKMQNSYLILDEYMRFLDCTKGAKEPSRSLLDVGVDNALNFSGFDEKMFFKRGGKYVWSKADMQLDW
ncbi:radical S-adenosyl methionine domain-containing protein 2-like [Dreissena polymorpha]|uniref:radical S-adenosyl methionine domain-containing protein 2-like n=1 Tax=Dreissena polymorpha TaxID=45954 RepID=UPI0022653DDD|nr:radical S-adenosyl methionine domain-containing protein 2-like [Dreissena polymorpha]